MRKRTSNKTLLIGGIAALVIHIHVQRGKARPLGQEIAAHDAVRQGGVAPL